MNHFEYGKKETDYLKSRDGKLGGLIDRMGIIRREIMPDPFTALVSSIVGQQISNKAAETVWNKLTGLLGSITPGSIMKADLEDIRHCGMSERKARYIKGIAHSSISGEVDFDELHRLSDQEIVKKLSALQGVGVWTAEMLLIFSLCRTDVLSSRDLGIRRGIMKLYRLEELSKEEFERYRSLYSPYGSIASFYLWALAATD